jgi:hypothetical protein
MWYNGRPTLGAAAGFSVMSSDINFFVQNVYKRMFAMSSHNGHCAPAEHECVGRFLPPHRPIWNFFAQSSGPICAPNLPKTETPYGRCATNPEGIARKYVKYFFVKLTKYIFKKI